MKTTIGMFALAFAVTAASAGAQAPSTSAATTPRFDARWTPYLGCWRLLQENVGMEATVMLKTTPGGPAIVVCVQPSAATSGVTMTTFADGKRVLEQHVVADSVAHQVAESGCSGAQTSEWSNDGLRLFTHVNLACNDRPAQSFSGLTLFGKGPAWIDIQATSGDEQRVRVRRYTRTAEQPAGVAALPSDTSTRAALDALAASVHHMNQADVTEASKKVASQVVEAAIVETEARFALDSRVLKQLADAGVPPSVAPAGREPQHLRQRPEQRPA